MRDQEVNQNFRHFDNHLYQILWDVFNCLNIRNQYLLIHGTFDRINSEFLL